VAASRSDALLLPAMTDGHRSLMIEARHPGNGEYRERTDPAEAITVWLRRNRRRRSRGV